MSTLYWFIGIHLALILFATWRHLSEWREEDRDIAGMRVLEAELLYRATHPQGHLADHLEEKLDEAA